MGSYRHFALCGFAGLSWLTVLVAADPPVEDTRKYANPGTARLQSYIGAWRVTERHLNIQGKVIATVKGTEENTWVLDRRAVRRAYLTSTDKTIFRAIGMIAYNVEEATYDGVWFDNASQSGPTITKGTWDEQTRTLTFISTPAGTDGSGVKYKIVEQFLDDERRLATTFKIDGKEITRRLEVQYVRTIPCPASGPRRIFDG